MRRLRSSVRFVPPSFRLTAVAAVVALLASMVVVSIWGSNRALATGTTTSQPVPIPPSGTLTGGFVNPGETAFEQLESQVGRTFDAHRIYNYWDDPVPGPQVLLDESEGILPVLSIKATTRSGTIIPWAGIAAGTYDSTLIADGRGLAAMGKPIILAFNHEPTMDPQNGTPADFVAAFQHFVTVIRAQGASNVAFALILQAGTYSPTQISAWYPGDAYVDWMGADGYNWANCTGKGQAWEDFSTIFSDFYSFGIQRNKPMLVAEFASREDPANPNHKAQWISNAAQTLESWPQVKLASYFDATGTSRGCDWPVTSSAAAFAAYKDMVMTPFFNPRPRTVLSASPASGPTPFAAQLNTSGTVGMLQPLASWTVTYGDGTQQSGSGAPPGMLNHSYTAGTYTATLGVVDQADQTASATTTITVYPLPTVSADPGYATSTTSLAVGGNIVPGGIDTSYQVQYGTSSALGSATPSTDIGSGTRNVHVSVALSGLQPATTYDWRLVAVNAAGTVYSPIGHLTTFGGAPGISSVTRTPGSGTQMIAADINPHQVDTTWYCQWGTSTSYGNDIPLSSNDIGSGSSPVAVQAAIGPLTTGVTYHYRVVATNQVGTTVTTDRSFKD